MKNPEKVLESRKQIYWKIRKRVLESPGFSVNFFCGSHVCGLGFLSSIYGFRISSIIHGMFCKACSEVEVPILTDNGWRNFVCDCRNLFVLLASFLTFFLSSEFVPNIRECLDMNPMSVRLYSFYDDITVFCLRRSEVKRLHLNRKVLGWFLFDDDSIISFPLTESIGSE